MILDNPLTRLVRRLWAAWKRRKQLYAEEVFDSLKIRYQTFRVLLADNERCLSLLNELDSRIRGQGRAWPGMDGDIKELLHVSYELVDGLSFLSGGRFNGLYHRHAKLSQAVRQVLADGGFAAELRPACLSLEKTGAEERKTVGGKAWHLSRLIRLGMPAPDGFVVTVEAGRRFLVESDVNYSLRSRLRRLESRPTDSALIRLEADAMREEILGTEFSQELRQEIAKAYAALAEDNEVDPAVSLRSSAQAEDSAGHSFAGQFSTELNVRGLDAVLQAYKVVLASGFNARSITYRLRRGLPLAGVDMAVLCQRMVPAVSAGVLFSVDPTDVGGQHTLITAVPGLGLSAVDGETPADIYRLSRSDPDGPIEQRLARKTEQCVPAPQGGVHFETVPESRAGLPLLSDEQARAIAGYGRMAEAYFGLPQDMEWAIDHDGNIQVLQSRPLSLGTNRRREASMLQGRIVLQGGVLSSGGRGVGRVRLIRSATDLETEVNGPEVAVMHYSLVRAARLLPLFQGVVVELGNPADHLSCVAREYGVPMLTGVAGAVETLQEGQWILLDADQGVAQEVSSTLARDAEALWEARQNEGSHAKRDLPAISPELRRLRELTTPLNLTDAYGPSFSIMECKSLHDIIRYVHEKAVLEMFKSEDEVVEEASSFVRRIRSDLPFSFLVIDLGGGLSDEDHGRIVELSTVRSEPFLALWQGLTTPGLRWGKAPPDANISGLISHSLLDAGGERPVGSFNYALITSDYLNLNARVDYHFAMIDSVCGAIVKENYIRFRFKGGGTALHQRERRATFIAEVLIANDFFVDQQSDLVTGTLQAVDREGMTARLTMLGRLLGFSRLLDATMLDDERPHRVAEAFVQGDYDLESLRTA